MKKTFHIINCILSLLLAALGIALILLRGQMEDEGKLVFLLAGFFQTVMGLLAFLIGALLPEERKKMSKRARKIFRVIAAIAMLGGKGTSGVAAYNALSGEVILQRFWEPAWPLAWLLFEGMFLWFYPAGGLLGAAVGLSAVLLIVVQQTMFYGVSMLTGTMREENRSFAVLPDRLKGHGISRTVMGRGAAYWLLYIAIGAYVAALVPRIFGLPQNCPFGEIFILLLFYVTACVVFSFTFSSLIRHRETVFVLFLFMSPICLFLTGFSWPASSFPGFWKVFSYIFPSTFAVQAFINMNTAGASLSMAAPQIAALTIQIIVYYFLSCLAVFAENRLLRHKGQGSLRPA